MKRKHALLLAPLSAGLVFAAVVELGEFAAGKPVMAALASVFKDPLRLFAERSPGVRGDGVLLSIKPERMAAIPHERVLSGVRERDPAPFIAPDIPDYIVPAQDPGTGGALPNVASDNPGSGTGNPGFGPSPVPPLRRRLGAIPQGQAAGAPPVLPGGAGDGVTPEDPAIGLPLLPADAGDGVTPLDPGLVLPPAAPALPIIALADPPLIPGLVSDPPTDPGPGSGPTIPPDTTQGPGTTAVPEPATWTMMLLGLIAVAARRPARQRG